MIGGPAPQPVAPTTKVAAETASRSLFKSLFQKEGEPKSIASGLMGTKAILLAPTAATLIDPSMTHNGGGPNGQQNKNGDKAEKITKWIPPPQLKPKERNLVRKVSFYVIKALQCWYRLIKHRLINPPLNKTSFLWTFY